MLTTLPKVYLLLTTSAIILLWVGYFVRSLYKERTKVNHYIYSSYILYALFIILWILSNAYFQSPLLTYFDESTAIFMALFANMTSYLAFAFAFLFSCRLASKHPDKRLSKWQFRLTSITTLVALIVNVIPNLTVIGVTIQAPSVFTIEFGPFAPLFFLNAFLFVILTSINFFKLRKSNIKLNKEKSIYLMIGIFIYMISTIASQIIIPVIWADFSYTWVPPALSVTEALLIGYTLLYHRLYSFKYLLFWSLSYSINLILYLIPIIIIYDLTAPSDLLYICIIAIVFTGLFWDKTLKKTKKIASIIIYKDKQTPVEKIYKIAEEFKYSSSNAIIKLASILNTPKEELLLIGKNTNYNIFIPHLNQSHSALVKDELDYQIHYSPKTANAELHQVQEKMSESKTALILPIFGENKLISHFLISANKHDNTTFSNEEISAIQWVLTKVQGYIESERKVRQSQALANSIAHEMRNPLSQLQYHFEKIKHHYQKNTEHEKQEALIKNELNQGCLAIQKGAQLIDIILSEAKNTAISDDLFHHHSISLLTQQIIDEYVFDSEEMKQKITLDLEDDFVVNINDTLYGFILFNLLRNATYYFDEYNSFISIRLVKGFATNKLIFRDTGPGIDSHILPNIFDDFFTHNKEGGSGLGLSYCLRVMHAFEGNIACYSTKGEFTEFVLSFPHIEGDINALNSHKPNTPPLINKKDNSLKTVLIVDDKKVQRMLIHTFINKDNLTLLQAENGEEAVEIATNNKLDLIFMDSRMPVMNGIDAAKKIKIIYPNLPIIALTGESSHEEISAITQVMDGYLTKPVSKAQLQQVVDKWL
ncbi:autoinducer hybrid sensor kinase/response regulator AinR [Aliivibrio fischeri]|uniref:autoinducer hybrid sensor kinase/response regulator AinR n=1 Tax=Aliivibrio fischeri TaxID=668 RepID=UPI0012DAE85B|nr:autoinducer hybrid sensor kinase/response regulator AinR [Aliivibrio fischeri]MUL10118.1 response regulator [Aliivibrio fischeri]MUL14827.1 response regulator [Aliivibrio fischeri]